MKTYITIMFNSEGSSPSKVKDQLLNLGFKVAKGNKIKFSPHQIAWHKTHPKNTYIIVEARGQRSSKTSSIFLYRGSRIMELDACGLKLEATAVGLEACCLELEACGLTLETLIV